MNSNLSYKSFDEIESDLKELRSIDLTFLYGRYKFLKEAIKLKKEYKPFWLSKKAMDQYEEELAHLNKEYNQVITDIFEELIRLNYLKKPF